MTETRTMDVLIKGADGNILCDKKNIETPIHWSDTATNIAVDKYFQKGETSVVDMLGRVVDTIFDNDPNEIEQYYPGIRDRLKAGLIDQRFMFNSPVLFNFYPGSERLQGSACFIFSQHDNMQDLLEKAKLEGEVYWRGSGVGANWSRIRGAGEPLRSSEGYASGPLSFIGLGSANAKAIKSGGKTRRAAKMVILNIDHPDVESIITRKRDEERKARALIKGDPKYGEGGWECEAYQTVGGQNANWSIGISDAFMNAVVADEQWNLISPVTNEVVKTVSARYLMNLIAECAHECGDPGIVFTDTMNRYNPLRELFSIWATNPCGEFKYSGIGSRCYGPYNSNGYYM